MRAVCVCLPGILLTTLVVAQEKDPGRWQGSGNVGLTLASGNSDSLRATAGLELTRAWGSWDAGAAVSILFVCFARKEEEEKNACAGSQQSSFF